MEKMNDSKFQKLDFNELEITSGGRKLVYSSSCETISDSQFSRSVYTYNWFERNILGHECTEEVSDASYSCDNPVVYNP